MSQKLYFVVKKRKMLMLKIIFIYYKDEKIIDLSDIVFNGNIIMKILCVQYLIAKQFNVANCSFQNVLEDFAGVEHRFEL
jgi:UDP-N-acetylmuramoylalanine-D-glutamate ligase